MGKTYSGNHSVFGMAATAHANCSREANHIHKSLMSHAFAFNIGNLSSLMENSSMESVTLRYAVHACARSKARVSAVPRPNKSTKADPMKSAANPLYATWSVSSHTKQFENPGRRSSGDGCRCKFMVLRNSSAKTGVTIEITGSLSCLKHLYICIHDSCRVSCELRQPESGQLFR